MGMNFRQSKRRVGVWPLVLLGLAVVFGSQYIRQLSIDSGPFRELAVLILGLTDSQGDQWLTMVCLGGYYVAFTCFLFRLRRAGAGTSSNEWWSFWLPEFCLLIFAARVVAAYGLNYQTAYFFSDSLTLFAGVTIGRVVAVWRCWRADQEWAKGVNTRILSTMIFLLAGASLFHPYMGRTFYYREQERWIGPYYNPNTFGLLMGVGVVLAVGLLIWNFGSRTNNGDTSSFRGWRWLRRLFFGAGVGLCGLGLVNSFSRGSWLGTFCGLTYLIGMTLPLLWRRAAANKRRVWRQLIPSTAILVLSVVVLAFWNFRHTENRVVRRVFSVGNPNDFSWRNRVTTGMGALQMMADCPWLGFGWNQVERQYTDLYRVPKLSESSAISLNDYFVIGVSVGLPALMGMLVYVWWRFRSGHASYLARLSELSALDWQMMVCRAGLLVLAVGFVVEKGIFYIAMGAPFWMLLELGAETRGAKHVHSKNETIGTMRDIGAPVNSEPLSTGQSVPDLALGSRISLPPETNKKRRIIYGIIAAGCGLVGLAYVLLNPQDSEPDDPLFHKVLAAFQASQPIAVNISPDGQYILTKIEERRGFKVSVVERSSGREIATSFSKNTQRSLTWRPDSRAVVFQDSPGANRPLHMLDLASRKTRRLNAPVSQTALPPLRWDAKGRRLAYFQGDWRKGRLLVIDLDEDEPPLVVKSSVSGSCDFVWSPSGNALAIVDQSTPERVAFCAWTNQLEPHEFSVDMAGTVGELAWSPDGQAILATVRAATNEYFKLVKLDPASRSAALIAEGAGDIKYPVWFPDSKSFFYHILSDGTVQAVFQAGEHDHGRIIGPTNGVLRITHVDTEGARAYARFAALTSPPSLLEIPLATGKAKVIYEPPNSAALECPAPQSISLKSTNAVNIPAYHWRAQDVERATKAALIVVHGGLHTQTYPTWEAYLKVMLESGCDVIAVNYSGSSGYGQTFEMAGSEFDRIQDVLAARNYVIANLKIPPEKILLFGISSGAGLSVKAAAQGEQFGGLVLASSVVVKRPPPPLIKGSLRIVELHGDDDLAVSAERAQDALKHFFAENKNQVTVDCHLLKGEGHFFYKTASWARVYWEALKLIQTE